MKKRIQGQRANLETSKLFLVTIQLIAKHGYFDVSFQKIANAMGVSQSTVMHYFPNRVDMMRSLFQVIVRSNHQYVAANADPKDCAILRLKKHLSGNFNWAIDQPEMASLVGLLYYQASCDVNFSKLYDDVLKVGRSRIYEYLLMASREGDLKSDIDLLALAEVIHESSMGQCINGVSQLTLGRSKRVLRNRSAEKADALIALLRNQP